MAHFTKKNIILRKETGLPFVGVKIGGFYNKYAENLADRSKPGFDLVFEDKAEGRNMSVIITLSYEEMRLIQQFVNKNLFDYTK